ncbi:MAG: ABC transporter ATP-binding protein [Bacteroidales bacterium]|nr:ABC transporter ATP-binding protein [Bacteroidales bacterium]
MAQTHSHQADMVCLASVSVGYRRQPVLSDVSVCADRGELVALVGRNGMGKSTLMRTIARLQPKLSGDVLLCGKPVEGYSRNRLSGTLSIVSTEIVSVSHLTVKQLVSFGRFPHTNWIGRLTADDMALVEEAIQLTGIASIGNKKLYQTSDGERQRAMIARTLAQDTPVILLDEPTAFLDMAGKYETVRLLGQLTRRKHKTIIFSTHDLNIAMQEADKLWLITDNGMCEGAPEDMALDNRLDRLFENSSLHFDGTSGTFGIRRSHASTIYLRGKEKYLFWTQKALERIGYEVVFHHGHPEDAMSVSVALQGQGDPFPCWTLQRNGQELRFNSILSLCRHLRDICT